MSRMPAKGYTPQKATVKIPRPSGGAVGGTTASNAPTRTQAHAASKGKTFISEPSETHGVRGGTAVSSKTRGQ